MGTVLRAHAPIVRKGLVCVGKLGKVLVKQFKNLEHTEVHNNCLLLEDGVSIIHNLNIKQIESHFSLLYIFGNII